MAAIDWTNPCEAAAELRRQYYQIEAEVQTRTLDAEERVRFQLDKDRILNELRTMEARCAASTGAANPNRRYAITAGGQRRCGPGGYW